MNVREALGFVPGFHETMGDYRDDLAPIIETALRAAYLEACLDDESRKVRNSNHGVTAGVAAMVEKDAPKEHPALIPIRTMERIVSDALECDGYHHVRWHLERLADLLDVPIRGFREGIAP